MDSQDDEGGGRAEIAKVSAISYDAKTYGNALADGEARDRSMFGEIPILPPPFPPEILYLLFEVSNCLRQNIDAYATNIDGFGHRLDPVIDLEAEDAEERIADMLMLEKALASDPTGEGSTKDVPEPTQAEVTARLKSLKREMRIERARLETWFSQASGDDMSFVTLRMRSRTDRETTGNAFWEAVRNGLGQLAEFRHVPAQSVRLLPIGRDLVNVKVRIQTTPISSTEAEKPRRFRAYVQVAESTAKIYFKEFGDPRVMSAASGRYYATPEALAAAEKGARPATEILHFATYSPRGGAYGVPRWMGNLPSVLGSRQAEEVNLESITNNLIPSLFILVSGGQLEEGAEAKIGALLEEFRQKRDRHGAIVIEATATPSPAGDAGTGKCTVDVKPMTGERVTDAEFKEYDERNRDKVGESFRVPRLVRGDTRDFNRATADAALTFFEQQVCAPERAEFDHTVNHKILPAIGVRYHKFVSQGPQLDDPEARAKIISTLTDSSILTAREAREEAAKVLGRVLRQLDGEWLDLPPALVLAGMADPLSAAGMAGVDEESEAEGDGAKGGQRPEADAQGDDAGEGKKGEAKPKGNGRKVKPSKPATAKALVGQAARLLLLREILKHEEKSTLTEAYLEAHREDSLQPPQPGRPEESAENAEERA